MKPWVFFDVGNLLFNDEAQAFYGYRQLHTHLLQTRPELRFAEILAERETHARQASEWILHRIARERLGEAEAMSWLKQMNSELVDRYDEHHLLNPGVPEILIDLQRDFHLGIIANQTTECRASLIRRNLLDYFDVIAISDEVGSSKPEIGLFAWAIREAGCRAADSVMIGDRRDNDIYPAQTLGMKTIHVDWPSIGARAWQPAEPRALEFLTACEELGVLPHGRKDVTADRVVHDLWQIPTAVRQLFPFAG